MLKYKGGHKAGKGTYWNLSTGNRIDIADESALPGDNKSTYIRFPPSVMLLLGPILGLVYVIFLPIIAIATVIILGGGKLLRVMLSLIGKIIYFEWRPTEAYLAGKKKGKKKGDKKTDSAGRG